jgi:carboxyl-terminal processing protease
MGEFAPTGGGPPDGGDAMRTMCGRWVLRGTALVVLVGLVSGGVTGQVRGVQGPDPVAELRRQAEGLERAERWAAAAEVYADLLRRQPRTAQWESGLKRCLTHEQLARRYSAPVSRDAILRLPLDRAVELYGEVLAKIGSHYVDEVSLDHLLGQGLDHLEVALGNQTFLRTAFAAVPPEEAFAPYRSSLRLRWAEPPLFDRTEAQHRAKALAVGLQQDWGANPAAVIFELAWAACASLDDYSGYLLPDRLVLEKGLLAGALADVGLELARQGDRLAVFAVAPDGPAARAGLRPGDCIVKVNDRPADDLDAEEAMLRLFGAEGSVVSLEVRRGEASRRVALTRTKPAAPSVADARLIDATAGVGYVQVRAFLPTTPQELDEALAALSRQGLKALVIDLRGNPGGLVTAAVDVADRFIDSGVLLALRGRGPGSSAVYRAHAERSYTMPLVVLVDGETASAAEILAGALKDHRRALVVGQRTLGKGVVQRIFPLRSVPAGVRLTTARFYSPLDLAYQDAGVTPDVVVGRVEGPAAPMGPDDLQRLQLTVAVEAARTLLGGR